MKDKPMNIKHFKNLTDGAYSRCEYKKRRRAGRTPENAIIETLNCFESLEFRGCNGDIDHRTKDWFLAEIAAMRELLPISKF